MADAADRTVEALREHLAVCNDLLALAQKEAEALKSSAPFPMAQIRAERKGLLHRLESAMRCVAEQRVEGERDPECADLVRTIQDTIMRLLVIDRENEQSLLRRGLLPMNSLPPAERSQPDFVAQVYQRHSS